MRRTARGVGRRQCRNRCQQQLPGDQRQHSVGPVMYRMPSLWTVRGGRTVGMIRDTTAATAGNNLTIMQAGLQRWYRFGRWYRLYLGYLDRHRPPATCRFRFTRRRQAPARGQTAATASDDLRNRHRQRCTGSFGNQATTLQSPPTAAPTKRRDPDPVLGRSTGTGGSAINFNIYGLMAQATASRIAPIPPMTIATNAQVLIRVPQQKALWFLGGFRRGIELYRR